MEEIEEPEARGSTDYGLEDFADVEAGELMACLADCSEGDEMADPILRELHRRLQCRLERRAWAMTKSYPGNHIGIADLIGETWWRIWKRARSFHQPADCRDPQALLERWAVAVMTNTLREVHRARFQEPLASMDDVVEGLDFDPQKLQRQRHPEPMTGTRQERAQMVQDCINALRSQKQQAVIWISASYFEKDLETGKVECRIPDEDRKQLCKEFQTTDNNLCQLRVRALKNVRKCIEKKTTQKGP